eukprot:Blabericola_migrator_1__9037@NODE_480_length_8144_cov_370_014362_g305_i1_p8_GENE_NODE_480_length_8144_cov_370_014362_g305_i1NODE_480_length_8144_cov_370_014362_g305_i1_p8_ORF_typecomplete_len131_score14_26_NODE_480_length_8144_cov_370_014362_g305_i121672559
MTYAYPSTQWGIIDSSRPDEPYIFSGFQQLFQPSSQQLPTRRNVVSQHLPLDSFIEFEINEACRNRGFPQNDLGNAEACIKMMQQRYQNPLFALWELYALQRLRQQHDLLGIVMNILLLPFSLLTNPPPI